MLVFLCLSCLRIDDCVSSPWFSYDISGYLVNYCPVISCWAHAGCWFDRCGGWISDGYHIVCHEVLSLETPCLCVISMLLWYLGGLLFLLLCCGGHGFYVNWYEVGRTLRCLSWYTSWSECYVPLWAHPRRCFRGLVWRCLWDMHPRRWCHLWGGAALLNIYASCLRASV